ncbi:MAG: hypothetical protein AAGC60_05130 [Acidobacteriota bacterium]
MDPQTISEQNVIERYVTGRLTDDEVARFEEYFLEHPECAAEVRLAQRLHRGLEAVAAQDVMTASVATSAWTRWLRHRGALLLVLLLVGVALLPLSLLRRIDRLEGDLQAAQSPRVNTPIFELSAFRGVDLGTAPPHLLTLSSEPEWIVLTLALTHAELPAYRVELRRTAARDSTDDLLWEAANLRPDSLERLVITLPSSLLPAGDYELRAEGTTGEGMPVPAGRYALRVTIAP